MSVGNNGKASQIMTTIDMLRRERGWTQFELALAVGVQPQTVYLWESGRRQPKVSQMRKLGQVFGMCSDEIDLAQTPAAHAATDDSEQQGHTSREC
jgi:DNA-binding XRE family transcriptional regulator